MSLSQEKKSSAWVIALAVAAAHKYATMKIKHLQLIHSKTPSDPHRRCFCYLYISSINHFDFFRQIFRLRHGALSIFFQIHNTGTLLCTGNSWLAHLSYVIRTVRSRHSANAQSSASKPEGISQFWHGLFTRNMVSKL